MGDARDREKRGAGTTTVIVPTATSETSLRCDRGHTRLSNGVHFELNALVLLDAADYLKQVAGIGITGRSEHSH